MADYDQRQRFFFPDSDIRGEMVRLQGSYAQALGARNDPMLVQGLLGEALAAVTLLTGTLKFEGRLSLQAQGDGPITLLLAECTHDSQVRAMARYADELGNDAAPLPALLGDGMMAITIRPEKGNQYQGLVPLEGDSLASCLEDYFSQSEQLPSRLWLAAGNGHAAGLLLQRLPDRIADREHNAAAWDHAVALANTLTLEEMLDLPMTTMLHRLYHEQPPELAAPTPVAFGCTCSRQKVQNTLLSLGAGELRNVLDELGEARVSCDFCGREEVFDAVDLAALVHELTQGQA
ncbi:Hsp33 family molecular chaperone HslO [Isoalcanivorax beigongshangi]|uniref:33 kDa chaperonin n=1 Tax=Isoalcanivorax beigongshangi TaxID=3238810 RepID=A0ABV4ALK4_9GAMM